MKRVSKSRKGFTLVEMILVIAIIVIIASVFIISIGTYIGRAKKAASSLSLHNWSISKITSDIDAQM